tara:strand:- start:781 stop:1065 length:285 start_codon:yes stop_codon:yes gene_type:complete
LGDFKKFKSEKKPIKKTKNKNSLKVKNSLGMKIKIEIIKSKPPEKGGIILLLIKFLCLKTLFLSFKKLSLLKKKFNPNIKIKIIKNLILISIKN